MVSRCPSVGWVSLEVKLDWFCGVWLDFSLVELLGWVVGSSTLERWTHRVTPETLTVVGVVRPTERGPVHSGLRGGVPFSICEPD